MATQPSAAAPAPEPVSPVMGLIDVFINPGRLFAGLAGMPKWGWLLPLAIGVLVAVVIQIVLHPYSARAVLGMITDDMSPQMAQALRDSAAKPAVGWSLIWQPIGYAIAVLIGAGVLTGLATMFTAKGKFMLLFTGLMFAKLVLVPSQILTYVIVSLRGVDSVNNMMDLIWTIGPAMFVTSNKLLFNILTQIQIFEVWYFVLLVILVEKVTGAKRGTCILVAAIYWLLGAAVQVGLLAMTGLH
ncbi:MAG: YIP1 family protein [Bryobacteraceae bacterium]